MPDIMNKSLVALIIIVALTIMPASFIHIAHNSVEEALSRAYEALRNE